MIIAFSSVKGGVSKTSSCVNLAGYLSLYKPKPYSVLIIDFDAQGGSTHHLSSQFGGKYKASLSDVLLNKCTVDFAIHKYNENLHMIPISYNFAEFSTKNFKKELEKLINAVRSRYNFIFFDLSPAIFPGSTIPLSIADSCIIPVYAKGGLSLLGLQAQGRIIVDMQEENPDLDILGILASFVDRTKVSREVVEYLKSDCAEETFKTVIRENTAISQASSLGKLVLEHAPKSNGSQDYKELAKEFLKRVKERQKISATKPKKKITKAKKTVGKKKGKK